jgi:hypothetical protein
MRELLTCPWPWYVMVGTWVYGYLRPTLPH